MYYGFALEINKEIPGKEELPVSEETKVQLDMHDDAKNFNWGGEAKGGTAAQYQVRIAEITIEFPEFDGSLAGETKIQNELQSLFQHLADQRFGAEHVTVEVQLRAGSLIITAILFLGDGYKFFHDYKQLHEGVACFAGDVNAARTKIEEIIKKWDW